MNLSLSNLINIETATSKNTGKLIGLRISHPTDYCKLLVYTEGRFKGSIRDGAGFIAQISDEIIYNVCEIIPAVDVGSTVTIPTEEYARLKRLTHFFEQNNGYVNAGSEVDRLKGIIRDLDNKYIDVCKERNSLLNNK